MSLTTQRENLTPNGEAEELLDAASSRVEGSAEKGQFKPRSIVPTLLGGAVGAVAGGTIWALISVIANVEVGIIALGVGGLSGCLVLLCSAGRKGVSRQIIAVVSSLMAIAVGKYLTAYYLIREAVAEEFGQQAASELSWHFADLVTLLLKNITVIHGYVDFLWVGLAVLAAWTITSPRFPFFPTVGIAIMGTCGMPGAMDRGSHVPPRS